MGKNRKIQLIRYFSGGARRFFAAAAAASLAVTALNSLTPQIFRFCVDSVLGQEMYPYLSGHLWMLALLLVAVAVLSGLSQYAFRIHAARAGEIFAKNMRDTLYAHIQRLPMAWHDENQTGDIIQRCTSDVEVIRSFVVTQLLEVFRTVFLVAVSFAMMLLMDVRLSMVVLVFVPVVVVYSVVFYRLTARRFVAADEAEGELSTVVQENATGVRVVRAFGRERFEVERFREKNDAFARLWIRLGTLSGAYWGIGDLITGLQVVAVLVLGTQAAVRGTLSVGEFIAFASYNTTLVWPVRGLGRVLSEMSKAGVSFERIDAIIRSEEEAYAPVGATARRDGDGVAEEEALRQTGAAACQKARRDGGGVAEEEDLRQADAAACQKAWRAEESGAQKPAYSVDFSHVSFAYAAGAAALCDVSFYIPAGTTFGILGGMGSGKSTLIQLLTRLYELSGEGRIRIGGEDIRSLPLQELRSRVGVVLQEPFLYSRSVRDNIAASRPDASLAKIRRAARIACIDETIVGFPDGYDTLVGERGVTLSGGQRQRVAIARTLLGGAPVMVFDDSFSAIDPETDQEIRKRLKKELKGTTVILISHRIATLQSADRILVLQKGRVAELGNHRELLAHGGIYRRIYEIQMDRDNRKFFAGEEG